MSALPGVCAVPTTHDFPRGVFREIWFWYLCGVAGASVVSLPLWPAESDSVAGAAATAAVVAGIRWHQPEAYRAWMLLAVAQATVTAALAAWLCIFVVAGRAPGYPAVIDVVYLSSYLFFAAGLALFVRRRAGRSPWEGVLQASLVTLGLAAVVWVLVIAPYLDKSGMPRLELATGLSYPSMDLLLVAMLSWLFCTAGLRTRSLLLLGAGFAVLLITDTLNATLIAHGGNVYGNDATLLGWDLSYALLGAAALHPSMAATIEQDKWHAIVASRWRMVAYLSLAVAGPVMAVVSVLTVARRVEVTLDTLVPMAIAAAISVLLVVRLTQIASLANDWAAALDRQAAELERSRQALFRAHQRQRAIFEHAPTGMAQLGRDGTIHAANVALAELLGQPASRVVGKDIEAFVHPGDAAKARALLQDVPRSGLPRSGESRLVDVRGDTVWASWVVSAVHDEHAGSAAIVVIADRTEAHRLEIELRHAQKLEAIGRLAAGVAHELNTPIQFIGDNVDFLGDAAAKLLAAAAASISGNGGGAAAADGLELDYLAGEIPEAVRQTKDGVQRVATIVQALKSFAYPSVPGQQAADLNNALTDTLTIARSQLRQVGTIETDLGQLPPVMCSVGDLNQAFLNLLINAADAVAETQTPQVPGRITVRSRHVGSHVEIQISDSGPGIPEELRDKIFEPFFTTKPVGQGTGQGLPLARSIIVDRHGGTIGFTATPGQGVTFAVTLPVAGRDAHVPAAATAISGAGS